MKVPKASIPLDLCIPQYFPQACSHWPAIRKWSIDYFKEEFPKAQLNINHYNEEVELPYFYQNYLDSKAKSFQEIMSKPDSYSIHESTDLLKQNTKLFEDLKYFSPFCNTETIPAETFYSFWYGSKDSITDLHTDNVDLFLFQISSEKRVRLLDKATDQNSLQAISKSEAMNFFKENNLPMNEKIAATIQLNTSNYSKLKSFSDELENFDYYEVLLQPGDVLFIPKDWWHSTKSLDYSFAVNLEVDNNLIDWNKLKSNLLY